MRSPAGLTHEGHEAYASLIWGLCKDVRRALKIAWHQYGASSRLAKRLESVEKRLWDVRRECENQYFRDYPETATIRVYAHRDYYDSIPEILRDIGQPELADEVEKAIQEGGNEA